MNRKWIHACMHDVSSRSEKIKNKKKRKKWNKLVNDIKIPILSMSTCDSRRWRRDFVSDAHEPKWFHIVCSVPSRSSDSRYFCCILSHQW